MRVGTLSKKKTNFTPDTTRDPSGETMTSQENFRVVDLGKVVSIKYQIQKSLAQVFILYNEKHCQNRSRFGYTEAITNAEEKILPYTLKMILRVQ